MAHPFRTLGEAAARIPEHVLERDTEALDAAADRVHPSFGRVVGYIEQAQLALLTARKHTTDPKLAEAIDGLLCDALSEAETLKSYAIRDAEAAVQAAE